MRRRLQSELKLPKGPVRPGAKRFWTTARTAVRGYTIWRAVTFGPDRPPGAGGGSFDPHRSKNDDGGPDGRAFLMPMNRPFPYDTPRFSMNSSGNAGTLMESRVENIAEALERSGR